MIREEKPPVKYFFIIVTKKIQGDFRKNPLSLLVPSGIPGDIFVLLEVRIFVSGSADRLVSRERVDDILYVFLQQCRVFFVR